MHHVGICQNCYPEKITVIGWSSRASAWRGVYHTPHPQSVPLVLEVAYLPLYEQQKQVEREILEIARAGGYEDVNGKVRIDLSLNDPAVAEQMRELSRTHRVIVEETVTYIRQRFAVEIGSLCTKRMVLGEGLDGHLGSLSPCAFGSGLPA